MKVLYKYVVVCFTSILLLEKLFEPHLPNHKSLFTESVSKTKTKSKPLCGQTAWLKTIWVPAPLPWCQAKS